MTVLALALAGGLGAIARVLVDGAVRGWAGSRFPYGTLLINITGSLLLGLVAGLALAHGLPAEVRTIVGVGFCGGYTTFSTASVETVRLAEQRRYLAAVGNAVGTLLTTAFAGALGLLLAGVRFGG